MTPANKPYIYQAELTAACNMRCGYCPWPGMERRKGHMSADTLQMVIDYARTIGQTHLVLHHFGEPLLHPDFEERLRQVASAGLSIEFSTNGLLLAEKLDILLAISAPISITLSMHRWAEEGPVHYWAAFLRLKQRLAGTNIKLQKAFNVVGNSFVFHDWTQAAPPLAADARQPCFFLAQNAVVILWNGDVASCCADHEGASRLGHVSELVAGVTLRNRSWSGCATCSLFKPEPVSIAASSSQPRLL